MDLKELVGEIATNDTGLLKRARIHQGWWRAFVLKKEQGKRPNARENTICNTVPDCESYLGNFINPEIGQLAMNVAEAHSASHGASSGIVQFDRLKNNLLSSQPLCFNFFGFLKNNPEVALKSVQKFFPGVTEIRDFKFEYAPTPKNEYTDDNSAFDIALEVKIDGEIGLIGLECKYTESFSPKAYQRDRYKELYNQSPNFLGSYEELTDRRFNQLFRNQMIAESLLQKRAYRFVKTGLFCSDEDERAQKTASDFGSLLNSDFTTITFMDLIAAMQMCDLSIAQRKSTMMLWARYVAHELSEQVFDEY